MKKGSPTIWIDADACPKQVKETVYKNSARLKLQVRLVANSFMNVPHSPLISLTEVDQGDDVADKFILDNAKINDVAITADIPLASDLVNAGVHVLNPRGEIYTKENISERLSVRDFMKELRDSGLETGGPKPFGPKDIQNFTNALNRLLTSIM
jgi:uncharacterized protein YaiI (UPF0178 family)